jgi:hypothetical protein
MSRYIQGPLIATLVALATPTQSQTTALPRDIARLLPAGYAVMTFRPSDFNSDGKVDYVVVVSNKNEDKLLAQGDPAPKRSLLVFMQGNNGKFSLDERNDDVVFAADEGGQCDPFIDGEEGLAVKGAFFTVQNAVACGDHWTDFITFRYSSEHRHFIFHTRILESMRFNNSNAPGADALVPGKRSVTNANKMKPILLRAYKPNP